MSHFFNLTVGQKHLGNERQDCCLELRLAVERLKVSSRFFLGPNGWSVRIFNE
jgi:hypothetical protein